MHTNPLLHLISKLYGLLIKTGSNLESFFLLYMRLTWGHQSFVTGFGKLMHIDQVTQFFASLNIPYPHFNAILVGSTEMVCGLLLFVGLASRLAAIPLIIVMLTALSTAHAPNISNFRFLTEPMLLVNQAPYPFLITAMMVFVFGPGRISVDALIKRWVDRQPRY